MRRSDGSLRAAADLGELARSVVDEVGEKFLIFLARVLAIVLELANGIDDVLLVVVGAVDDALSLVLRVLNGLGRGVVGLRKNLVSGALRDDERLRDGVAVGLLLFKLQLELADACICLVEFLREVLSRSRRRRRRGGRSFLDRLRWRVKPVEARIVQLILQVGDLVVEIIDLIGDMLEKHIDFVDVVALAVDRETLVVNFSRGDSHLSSLRQQSLHLYSKPISSLTPNCNTSNATIGLTSTIPPIGGMNFLKRLRYGSQILPRTVLMSARMPRSVGNQDSMTYTKMSIEYTSDSDTIRYFRLSTR